MLDLYSIPLKGDPLTLCGGNVGDAGTAESCALVTPIPGVDGAYAVGDTKREGQQVRFTERELLNLKDWLNNRFGGVAA
ncbi:hypothetical protein [Amycolatopsis sp. lyj-23]|uniref:hypothetical protein n=1 Tax=Amycolatopsis sp. lyj-23 TaxID=2789283 RepID=UPI00397B4540